MTEKTQLFQFAGERPAEKTEAEKKKKWYQDRPVAAELFLGLLVLGCLFCRQIMTKDPSYMDLKNEFTEDFFKTKKVVYVTISGL